MARKKRAASGGGDDEGGWLVSYADMMTLIACFFILMMAFANYDPSGFNKKANELSQSFQKGKFKSSETKMTQISEEISKHPELEKKSKVSVVDNELIITFSSSILFDEGGTQLSESSLKSLDTMIDIIRSKDPNFKIVIEGHSDSFEYKSIENIESSWELGAIRAARILSRFEYFGFNPKSLIAITKGDSEPLVENAKEDNTVNDEIELDPNRRVMIKVIENKDAKKKVKFGFGIYFNEK